VVLTKDGQLLIHIDPEGITRFTDFRHDPKRKRDAAEELGLMCAWSYEKIYVGTLLQEEFRARVRKKLQPPGP
jgi:hypothetical protein